MIEHYLIYSLFFHQEELQPMDVTTNPPRFKMMLDHEVQELVFNWRIALTFSEAIKGKPYNIDNAFVDQEEGGTFFCLKPRNSHVMMQAGSKLHLEFFCRIKEALPTATYEFLPNTKECDGASTSGEFKRKT